MEEDGYDIASPYLQNNFHGTLLTKNDCNVKYSKSSTTHSTAIKTIQSPYYGCELELDSRLTNGNGKGSNLQCIENIVVSQNPYYE